MSETSEIVRYTRADRPQVFAFLGAAASAADSARLMRQWDWKYDANPFNRDSEPYLPLWRDAGEIAGMLGILPLRVCIDGAERWVGHPCDWLIHPNHRGRRMARRLIDRVRLDWPVRFSWQNELAHRVSPGDPATDGKLRLTPMAKPVDAAYLVERATGSHLLGRAGGIIAKGPQYVTGLLNRHSAIPGLDIAESQVFDDRFDRLWQRARQEYPVIVVRDQRYLQWRFAARPDAHYQTFVATRAGELLGYLVLRCLEKAGARWGYVVDFLMVERSTAIFSQLVAHAVAYLERDGVKAISCRVVVPPFRRVLARHGFLPVILGARGYLRTYRPQSESPEPALLTFQNPDRWFVTMGDGDVEMDL